MKKTSIVTLGLVLGVIAITNTAHAAAASVGLGVRASVDARAGSSTVDANARVAARLDQTTAKLQARAAQEIDRRLSALNSIETKIQAMVKVSASEKSVFNTGVQAQINLLNNLKLKISADTDAATLKADVQSITKAYRIYALILPQMQVVAAADRIQTTADLLSAYQAKLQARITTEQAAGKDVTKLQASITDMSAKISDANEKASVAISGVTALNPDNGDKTIMASNTTALKAARDSIKAGVQDLKGADKDSVSIRVGIKAFEGNTQATSTTSTQ